MDRKKNDQNHFLVVITTNPNLWDRKIFIETTFFGERAFAGVVGQKIWIL